MPNVVNGLDRITQALRRFPMQAAEASAQGQVQAYVDMMRTAKARTPVDEGWLRDSGYVSDPEVKNRSVVVEAGFGGAAEAYVVRQHEGHATQSKFFESALKDHEKQIKTTIASFVRDFLQSRTVKQANRGDIPKTPIEVRGPTKTSG